MKKSKKKRNQRIFPNTTQVKKQKVKRRRRMSRKE